MLSGCLAALTAALGLPPYSGSGDGPFLLRLEGDWDLSFERRGGSVAVSLPLVPLPAQDRERREFLREALKISLGLMAGGRAFPWPALHREGVLGLEARLPGEPRAFVDEVESLLNEAEKWRLALRNALAGAAPSPALNIQGLRP